MRNHRSLIINYLFISLFVSFIIVLPKTVGATEMWQQTYGGTERDAAGSLVQTGDGGYALAGGTESFGAGNSDFLLVKTDEHGVIPEFPSWVILPLFIITTLFAITFKKRLFHQSS